MLEAIAAHYGFGPEGGNRNLSSNTTEHNHVRRILWSRALRLSFDRAHRSRVLPSRRKLLQHRDSSSIISAIQHDSRISYGGQSLHSRSHGETFFTLLEHKFRRNGLFLLDEPEAALSPQRQLAFLVLMHDTLRQYKDAQFIISTHSPVLLGYPEAQILSFDSSPLRWIDYEETAPLQIVRYFLNNREDFLKELFAEPLSLFDQKKP